MGILPLERKNIWFCSACGWGQHRKHKKAYCLLRYDRVSSPQSALIFFKQMFLTQPAGKTKCLCVHWPDYIVRDVTHRFHTGSHWDPELIRIHSHSLKQYRNTLPYMCDVLVLLQIPLIDLKCLTNTLFKPALTLYVLTVYGWHRCPLPQANFSSLGNLSLHVPILTPAVTAVRWNKGVILDISLFMSSLFFSEIMYKNSHLREIWTGTLTSNL